MDVTQQEKEAVEKAQKLCSALNYALAELAELGVRITVDQATHEQIGRYISCPILILRAEKVVRLAG